MGTIGDWFSGRDSEKVQKLKYQLSNRDEKIDELINDNCKLERKVAELEATNVVIEKAKNEMLIKSFPIGGKFMLSDIEVTTTSHLYRTVSWDGITVYDGIRGRYINSVGDFAKIRIFAGELVEILKRMESRNDYVKVLDAEADIEIPLRE